jgi:hypothetical protein
MQGISTAIVIVRVEMGLSFEVDDKTPTTSIHFASATTPPTLERSSKYIVD